MKNKLVSIVLPCYNGSEFLLQTLESIKRQTYVNYEIVFIDDASNDRTLETFSLFIDKNEEIVNTVIKNEMNLGFIRSLELGLENANGDFIARIDADDYWTSNHLESIMDKFSANNKLILVGTNCFFVNKLNVTVGKSKYYLTNKEIIKGMMKDNVFIHSSVIFKRSAYNLTSGYRAPYEEREGREHIADYNLWFELMKFGEVSNIKERTVFYRVLESSLSRNLNIIVNYQARLFVMRNVFNYYKTNWIYSMFQRNKVNLLIFVLKLKNIVK